MAKNDAATLVVGSANFFVGPVGTAMPASLAVTPSAPWENIGHTSLEDIFSITSEGGEATTLGTLQNKTLRTTYSPRTDAFSITVQQFDRKTLRLYYGANAQMLEDGLLAVPQDPVPTERAFLAVFVDGENRFALYAPKAEIFRGEDMAIQDAESLAGLPLTIKPLVYGSNTWAYALTPLGGIPATGAIAGTPGTYEPEGADLPINLAALQAAITAANVSPSSAWTAGQYVELDDGTTAYWDGSAWQAGIAS